LFQLNKNPGHTEGEKNFIVYICYIKHVVKILIPRRFFNMLKVSKVIFIIIYKFMSYTTTIKLTILSATN